MKKQLTISAGVVLPEDFKGTYIDAIAYLLYKTMQESNKNDRLRTKPIKGSGWQSKETETLWIQATVSETLEDAGEEQDELEQRKLEELLCQH